MDFFDRVGGGFVKRVSERARVESFWVSDSGVLLFSVFCRD